MRRYKVGIRSRYYLILSIIHAAAVRSMNTMRRKTLKYNIMIILI